MKICEHFTNVEQDCFCKMKQKVLGTIESYDGEECGKCPKCAFMGKKEADCPKWTCDRTYQADYYCDRCTFIEWFIDIMRKQK